MRLGALLAVHVSDLQSTRFAPKARQSEGVQYSPLLGQVVERVAAVSCAAPAN